MKGKSRVLIGMFLLISAFTILDSKTIIADASDFVVEDGVLVAYNGSGGDVVIPDNLGITKIGENVFYVDESIVSVVVPEGVTTMAYGAFNECVNLSSVTLPNTLTEIDFSSFIYDSSLRYIKIPASVTNIVVKSMMPFMYTVSDEGLRSSFETVDIDVNNQTYFSIDGVVFSKDKKKLVYFPSDKTGEFVLPIETTQISEFSFYITKLQSITITKEVKVIGKGAFLGSAIENVIFEGETLEIGESAFASCGELKNVELPKGLKTISNRMFDSAGLNSVTLPEGLESIGEGAFNWCTLEGVILPNSLESIGDGAFYECFFKEVIIPENVEYIGADAFGIHYAWETPETGASYLETLHCVKGSVAENYAKEALIDIAYYDGIEKVELKDNSSKELLIYIIMGVFSLGVISFMIIYIINLIRKKRKQ